jgi:hypothetical protein
MKKSFLKGIISIWLISFPILFFLGIYYYYQHEDKQLKIATEITAKDSLNVQVNSCWVNRGIIHFNDNLIIASDNFNSKNSYGEKYIWEIATPFKLVKKYDNDTLKILCKNKNEVITFIFDSSKNKKADKWDITLKELFKKSKK